MIKQGLVSFIYLIIYILDLLFPKKRDSIVFFQAKERHNDNTKILFEHYIDHTDYDVHWLYEQKRTGDERYFVKRYSLKGLLLFLQARTAVISHGSSDFGLYKKNHKKIVQVWHGTPIKNIVRYEKKHLNASERSALRKEADSYDLFVVGSDIEKHYISSAFLLDNQKILVSGLPRNDLLLSAQDMSTEDAFLQTLQAKKVILYAPTFRDTGEMHFFPFDDFDLDGLEHFLVQKGAILMVRPHPNDKENILRLETLQKHSADSIILADSSMVSDINLLLPAVDVVITDYSSIYIDLLLKDIPPIFLPYDYEAYERHRGLAYDYELVTPGPKVFEQKTFIQAMDDALKGAPRYKERRAFVKRMFHRYDDAKACERIVDAASRLD